MKYVHSITVAILLISFFTACGRLPNASSSTLILPLALSGQSNAVGIRPALERAYAPGIVTGYSPGGATIAKFAVDAPEGYWSRLAPTLHQPLRAFVWWQGESDAYDGLDTAYPAALAEFISRVRRENNNSHLLVIICRVVNDPDFQVIRGIQERYVTSDPNARLVSSDDLPLEGPSPGSAHLSSDGYVQMAQRVIATLPYRR